MLLPLTWIKTNCNEKNNFSSAGILWIYCFSGLQQSQDQIHEGDKAIYREPAL